jgi:serine/threonine-protein kinase RsbW
MISPPSDSVVDGDAHPGAEAPPVHQPTVMDSVVTLVVPGTTDGIRQAERGLDDFSAAHGLDRNDTWPFHVALDEILSNVVKYGGEGGGEGRIEIRLRLEGRALEMVILDDASPFNPLEARAPDTTSPVEERPIGGLGIEIVRRLMDGVEYRRLPDHNQLTLRRRLGL